jgi:hypothetical protein
MSDEGVPYDDEPNTTPKHDALMACRRGFHCVDQPTWITYPPKLAPFVNTIRHIIDSVPNSIVHGLVVNGAHIMMKVKAPVSRLGEYNSRVMFLDYKEEIVPWLWTEWTWEKTMVQNLEKRVCNVLITPCDREWLWETTQAKLETELESQWTGQWGLNNRAQFIEAPWMVTGQVLLEHPQNDNGKRARVSGGVTQFIIAFANWVQLPVAEIYEMNPIIMMNQYHDIQEAFTFATDRFWVFVFVIKGFMLLNPIGDQLYQIRSGAGAWFPAKLAVVTLVAPHTATISLMI